MGPLLEPGTASGRGGSQAIGRLHGGNGHLLGDLGIAAPPAGTLIGLDLAHNDVDVAGTMPKQVDWAGLTAFAQPAKWRTGRLEAVPACSAP